MSDIRLPCGGDVTTIRWLGDCHQYGVTTSSYQVRPNVTTIYKFGNYIAPVDGDGSSYGPEPCTASEAATTIIGEFNCFQTTSIYVTTSCATIPSGWKGVRAQKYFQGTIPYDECLTPCWSGSMKYLRVHRKITGTLFQGSDPNLSGSLYWERQYFVNSGSGNITQEICTDTWDISNPDSSSVFLMPVDYGEIGHSVSCNQLYGSFDFATGTTTRPPGTDGNPDYDFAPIGLAGWILTERTLTPTYASYTISSFGPQPLMFEPNTTASSAWEGSITFTTDLSEPYSLGAVIGDAVNQLNLWDMSDDEQMKWRTDNRCILVPVVKRLEKWRTPESSIAAWGNCGTWSDTTQQSGSILGAPLPVGYGVVSASSPYGYYSFKMPYEYSDCVGKTGYWTPTELDPWAVWWSSQAEEGQPPCYAIGQFPKGAYLQVASNNLIHIQKYAAIQDIVPSFDYNCRPCSQDRNTVSGSYPICGKIPITSSLYGGVVFVTMSWAAPYLLDGDTIEFQNSGGVVIPQDASRSISVIDSTHFSMSAPQPVGTYVRSTGSWGLECDSGSKGDFIFLKWVTNQCDATYTWECSQSCNTIFTQCNPPVMAVLPPGAIENFPNGTVLPMNITANNIYFQAIPIGNISDPYGVTPDYYEARCTNPDGSPPLFVSYSLGVWDRMKWTWGPEWPGQPANGDCTTYSSDIEIGI